MDVSVWWIVGAAFLGLCAGMMLFAVLSMAADHEVEPLADAAEPRAQT